MQGLFHQHGSSLPRLLQSYPEIGWYLILNLTQKPLGHFLFLHRWQSLNYFFHFSHAHNFKLVLV